MRVTGRRLEKHKAKTTPLLLNSISQIIKETRKVPAACQPKDWRSKLSNWLKWEEYLDRRVGQVRPSKEQATKKATFPSLCSVHRCKSPHGCCTHRLVWPRTSLSQYYSQLCHSEHISLSCLFAYSDCCLPQLEEQSEGLNVRQDLGTGEESNNDQLANYYTGHAYSTVNLTRDLVCVVIVRT